MERKKLFKIQERSNKGWKAFVKTESNIWREWRWIHTHQHPLVPFIVLFPSSTFLHIKKKQWTMAGERMRYSQLDQELQPHPGDQTGLVDPTDTHMSATDENTKALPSVLSTEDRAAAFQTWSWPHSHRLPGQMPFLPARKRLFNLEFIWSDACEDKQKPNEKYKCLRWG